MDISKLCYFMITGASKGIGQKMALECSKKFKPGSVVVLLARSKDGLEKTKNQITNLNNNLNVKTYPIDLVQPTKEDIQKIIDDSLMGRKIEEFERAFIIHNVGSVGDPSKKATELNDLALWTDYYKLNVLSVAVLNAVFMANFTKLRKLIVNITSKCGIEPYNTLSMYCSGKAAREMYFKVLALEEADTVVLNYSPGPVDTEMFAEIENSSIDDNIRSTFKNLRKEKILLTTEQTTAKFLKVLEEFKFKSGDHIDYFD